MYNIFLLFVYVQTNTQAFKELLFSSITLQKVDDEDAKALYKLIVNNVCYVLEFRETVLYLMMNYNEAYSTK